MGLNLSGRGRGGTRTGEWMPTVSEVTHYFQNGVQTMEGGTVTIESATWVGDRNKVHFLIFGAFDPPDEATNKSTGFFTFFLTTPFPVRDLCGASEVTGVVWQEDDPSTLEAFEEFSYGGQGGGSPYLHVHADDMAPFNRFGVGVGMHTWAAQPMRKYFLVKGLFKR